MSHTALPEEAPAAPAKTSEVLPVVEHGPLQRVPTYSQLVDINEADWKLKACGITSLYMSMAFHWEEAGQTHFPTLNETLDYARSIGGYHAEKSWLHGELANTARHYGFAAVAMSWPTTPEEEAMMAANEFNIARMIKGNRLQTPSEVERYKELRQHSHITSALAEELRADRPIVASVKPGFGINKSGHLIVLTGYGARGDEVVSINYLDPQTEKPHHDRHQSCSLEHFQAYCSNSVILLFPP
ncbi:MAG: C39 family peptidase, partial [Acidobacteriota bacterium]